MNVLTGPALTGPLDNFDVLIIYLVTSSRDLFIASRVSNMLIDNKVFLHFGGVHFGNNNTQCCGSEDSHIFADESVNWHTYFERQLKNMYQMP